MSSTELTTPRSNGIPMRRRPPPTLEELAGRVRHANPANGLVLVEAGAGDHDICYFVVRSPLYGEGKIVIECHPSLAEADAAALQYARQEKCLFAPSWSYDPRGGRDAR